jgi:hypothetical protein
VRAKVYIETSVVSYQVAQRSRDIVIAGRQIVSPDELLGEEP